MEPSHGGGNLPSVVRRRLVPTVSQSCLAPPHLPGQGCCPKLIAAFCRVAFFSSAPLSSGIIFLCDHDWIVDDQLICGYNPTINISHMHAALYIVESCGVRVGGWGRLYSNVPFFTFYIFFVVLLCSPQLSSGLSVITRVDPVLPMILIAIGFSTPIPRRLFRRIVHIYVHIALYTQLSAFSAATEKNTRESLFYPAAYPLTGTLVSPTS